MSSSKAHALILAHKASSLSAHSKLVRDSVVLLLKQLDIQDVTGKSESGDSAQEDYGIFVVTTTVGRSDSL